MLKENEDIKEYTYIIAGKIQCKQILKLVKDIIGEAKIITLPDLEKLLIENYHNLNSKNVCMTCWCYCSRYQWIKHKELGHTHILTPRWFRDSKSFIKLASKSGHFKDLMVINDGVQVNIRLFETIMTHSDEFLIRPVHIETEIT